MKAKGATATFYVLGLIWLVVDQWTKMLTIAHLALGQVVPVWENWLAMTYTQNRGAAWSMFSDSTFLLGIVSAVVSLGLLVYERRFWPRNAWQTVGLALLWGGALGNMIDRFRFGYVVDMIYVQWQGQYFFPIFNVADIGVSCGVALLLLAGWRDGAQSAPERA